MGFWAKSLLVFNCFYCEAKQSIRDVARQTGFSKSSVHRLKQAILRRDQHPESWFWETREGQQWLIRLVVATLYTFGLKRGVGAETLSEFLLRLGLQSQIGCSPSALRHLMQLLEQAIVETTQEWEREGITQGQIGPIIGAVDETFLQCMMLVFMDLASGYLLIEEPAEIEPMTPGILGSQPGSRRLAHGSSIWSATEPSPWSNWVKRDWDA